MNEIPTSPRNERVLFDSERTRVGKLLIPEQRITSEDAKRVGITTVMIIANSRLKPENFDLRTVDYQTIGDLVYPGKSGMLDFLRLNASGVMNKRERDLVTELTFGKKSDRRDCAYVADIATVEEAGYCIFFAPVRTNGLHIRLVYEPHTKLEYPLLNDAPIVPRYNQQKIADIWRKIRCI